MGWWVMMAWWRSNAHHQVQLLECWLTHAQGGNPVDAKYYAQMQWQMRCADRSWCDYVVFDPRMPAKAQLFIYRVERNADWLKIAEDEVISIFGRS
jgi:hypothetical protein